MKQLALPLIASLLCCQNVLAEQKLRVDISSQPLAAALEQFEQQTGVQILYAADVMSGKTSLQLAGQYTAEQALKILLDKSGLSYRFTDGHTFAVRPIESASVNDVAGDKKNAVLTLEPMVVTATKTARKLSEVPVSTTIVNEEDLKRRGITVDLSDALLHEAGMDMVRSTPVSPAGLNLRGMGYGRSALLIDGQRSDLMFSSGQHPVQMMDPENVKRVEIVRGAGSALYGPYAMGGVVNVITREGEGPNKTRLRFGYDSLNTPQCGLSSSGSEDWFSYNLNFHHLDSEGYKIVPKADAYGQMSTQNNDWRQT